MAKAVEQIQKTMQTELDSLKSLQKEYQKAASKRQQLDAQLNENTIVKKELDLLKSDAEVFKMIGPVLVKQELDEAKENVRKRVDYIQNEIKRLDDSMSIIEKKQSKHREVLAEMQKSLQEATLKAAALS